MKRFYVLLIILYVILSISPAAGESLALVNTDEQPLYEAVSHVPFHIRIAPDFSSRRIKGVESHDELLVYEYGEQWCKVQYDQVTGYCMTEWLYRYRSLQPGKAFVPGYLKQEGYAQVKSPCHVSVHGYEGNDLVAGNLISVRQWNNKNALINMMRTEASADAATLIFTPYVPWDSAKSGDVIGGFTTFFNQKTGGRLSVNRQWNIELACSYVHGTVLPEGKTFSYNALCAPYTQKHGYKLAPNISNEGQGYGGGVCQLSTTIYNAVICLPLQIDEWALHRDIGVPYVPKGFDAAVGSYSDFSFRNTLPYAIRLAALPQNGALTVLIFRD